MCGIFAIAAKLPMSPIHALATNSVRGRDAWGLWASESLVQGTPSGPRAVRHLGRFEYLSFFPTLAANSTAIGNLRAEPTTEYVKDKSETDVQPYQVGDWVIVHNGTIANDKELCDEYGFEPPTRIDSWVIAALLDFYSDAGDSPTSVFEAAIRKLVGSYAICAVHMTEPHVVHFAMNYRPLHLHEDDQGISLSSVPLFPRDALLPPYSIGKMDEDGLSWSSLYPTARSQRALVVFSGGLDSTVAAAKLKHDGYDVTLLHFDYGARATRPERVAVEAVAARMNAPLEIITTPIFTDVIKGSRLTNTKEEAFAESEAGAEYAHEWVPARNLILTSIALGIAEARGFDVLALGANLEEAGAYPDNEPEFLRQFNKLIPFAVGDGKNIRIETPVGNLMKHEIVRLGLQVGAPMELTWSCYDAQVVELSSKVKGHWVDGEQIPDEPIFGTRGYRHCGKCGPCFMRKTAFEINGQSDPVFD